MRCWLPLCVGLLACGAPVPADDGGTTADSGAVDSGVMVDSGGTTADSAVTADSTVVVDAGPPSLELGTGDVVFEPMSTTLTLIYGIQGGHHFLVSLRARRIAPGNREVRTDPDNPQTVFRALVDGVQIDDGTATYGHAFLAADDDDGYVLLGRRLILDVPCADVDGAMVTIEASVEDSDGVMLRDTQVVVAEPLDPDTCVPEP